MTWLDSLLVGLVSAIAGLVLAGFIANACVSWYRISSCEGASGFYVMCTGLGGGITGFIIGVIAARIVGGYFGPGFGKEGLFNLGDGSGASGTILLRNTIIAGTANGASDFGSASINGGSIAHSRDHNLVRTNDGFSGGVLTNVDPRLAPLNNNGGPTLTHALVGGSPAVDAGDDANLPATDQRGFPRIFGVTLTLGRSSHS